MDEPTVEATVVCALPDCQIAVDVRLIQGASVGAAIDASDIAAMIWPNKIDKGNIGIFASKVTCDRVVEQGDRIEIYRPLTLDPMAARRRRAR